MTLQGVYRTGKISGKLVPYGFRKTNAGGQGDIPWRAGANENTTIEFFKMNTGKYPDDPNGFDSFGEAYKPAGNR